MRPHQALEELFVQELEELYDAEKQIFKGLGSMVKTAQNAELKAAFQAHQKQTKAQIDRLEESFRILGEKPERGDAPGIAGIIRQSKKIASADSFDAAVVDASLIASAQKIEHYEIAAYGCVRTHAGILGYKEIEKLANETLQEEEEADALLTRIAQSSVNADAAAAPFASARTGPRHNFEQLVEEAPGSEHKLSLGKLALGLLVGGTLSILLAPKSGEETRKQIGGALGRWSGEN